MIFSKGALSVTLVGGIGTKVNISTMGKPGIKIKVSEQLYQQSASDEIIQCGVTSHPGGYHWYFTS